MKNNNHHFAIHFGIIVRQLRLKMNISQEAFADTCAIHRTYIGAIERGEKNITLEMANRLAQALNIKLSDMIALVEEQLDD